MTELKSVEERIAKLERASGPGCIFPVLFMLWMLCALYPGFAHGLRMIVRDVLLDVLKP